MLVSLMEGCSSLPAPVGTIAHIVKRVCQAGLNAHANEEACMSFGERLYFLRDLCERMSKEDHVAKNPYLMTQLEALTRLIEGECVPLIESFSVPNESKRTMIKKIFSFFRSIRDHSQQFKTLHERLDAIIRNIDSLQLVSISSDVRNLHGEVAATLEKFQQAHESQLVHYVDIFRELIRTDREEIGISQGKCDEMLREMTSVVAVAMERGIQAAERTEVGLVRLYEQINAGNSAVMEKLDERNSKIDLVHSKMDSLYALQLEQSSKRVGRTLSSNEEILVFDSNTITFDRVKNDEGEELSTGSSVLLRNDRFTVFKATMDAQSVPYLRSPNYPCAVKKFERASDLRKGVIETALATVRQISDAAHIVGYHGKYHKYGSLEGVVLDLFREDLTSFLGRQQKQVAPLLSIEETLRYVATIADAIMCVHNSIGAHLNISPETILLFDDGTPARLDVFPAGRQPADLIVDGLAHDVSCFGQLVKQIVGVGGVQNKPPDQQFPTTATENEDERQALWDSISKELLHAAESCLEPNALRRPSMKFVCTFLDHLCTKPQTTKWATPATASDTPLYFPLALTFPIQSKEELIKPSPNVIEWLEEDETALRHQLHNNSFADYLLSRGSGDDFTTIPRIEQAQRALDVSFRAFRALSHADPNIRLTAQTQLAGSSSFCLFLKQVFRVLASDACRFYVCTVIAYLARCISSSQANTAIGQNDVRQAFSDHLSLETFVSLLRSVNVAARAAAANALLCVLYQNPRACAVYGRSVELKVEIFGLVERNSNPTLSDLLDVLRCAVLVTTELLSVSSNAELYSDDATLALLLCGSLCGTDSYSDLCATSTSMKLISKSTHDVLIAAQQPRCLGESTMSAAAKGLALLKPSAKLLCNRETIAALCVLSQELNSDESTINICLAIRRCAFFGLSSERHATLRDTLTQHVTLSKRNLAAKAEALGTLAMLLRTSTSAVIRSVFATEIMRQVIDEAIAEQEAQSTDALISSLSQIVCYLCGGWNSSVERGSLAHELLRKHWGYLLRAFVSLGLDGGSRQIIAKVLQREIIYTNGMCAEYVKECAEASHEFVPHLAAILGNHLSSETDEFICELFLSSLLLPQPPSSVLAHILPLYSAEHPENEVNNRQHILGYWIMLAPTAKRSKLVVDLFRASANYNSDLYSCAIAAAAQYCRASQTPLRERFASLHFILSAAAFDDHFFSSADSLLQAYDSVGSALANYASETCKERTRESSQTATYDLNYAASASWSLTFSTTRKRRVDLASDALVDECFGRYPRSSILLTEVFRRPELDEETSVTCASILRRLLVAVETSDATRLIVLENLASLPTQTRAFRHLCNEPFARAIFSSILQCTLQAELAVPLVKLIYSIASISPSSVSFLSVLSFLLENCYVPKAVHALAILCEESQECAIHCGRIFAMNSDRERQVCKLSREQVDGAAELLVTCIAHRQQVRPSGEIAEYLELGISSSKNQATSTAADKRPWTPHDICIVSCIRRFNSSTAVFSQQLSNIDSFGTLCRAFRSFLSPVADVEKGHVKDLRGDARERCRKALIHMYQELSMSVPGTNIDDVEILLHLSLNEKEIVARFPPFWHRAQQKTIQRQRNLVVEALAGDKASKLLEFLRLPLAAADAEEALGAAGGVAGQDYEMKCLLRDAIRRFRLWQRVEISFTHLIESMFDVNTESDIFRASRDEVKQAANDFADILAVQDLPNHRKWLNLMRVTAAPTLAINLLLPQSAQPSPVSPPDTKAGLLRSLIAFAHSYDLFDRDTLMFGVIIANFCAAAKLFGVLASCPLLTSNEVKNLLCSLPLCVWAYITSFRYPYGSYYCQFCSTRIVSGQRVVSSKNRTPAELSILSKKKVQPKATLSVADDADDDDAALPATVLIRHVGRTERAVITKFDKLRDVPPRWACAENACFNHIWQPDSAASTCRFSGCGMKMEGGTRHHCRTCGYIFCFKHSPTLQQVPLCAGFEVAARQCSSCGLAGITARQYSSFRYDIPDTNGTYERVTADGVAEFYKRADVAGWFRLLNGEPNAQAADASDRPSSNVTAAGGTERIEDTELLCAVPKGAPSRTAHADPKAKTAAAVDKS